MLPYRKAHIWLTVAACLSLLAVCAMATWGVNNEITDSLLLAMRLVGGVGIAAFVLNAALAVRGLLLTRRKQADRSKKM